MDWTTTLGYEDETATFMLRRYSMPHVRTRTREAVTYKLQRYILLKTMQVTWKRKWQLQRYFSMQGTRVIAVQYMCARLPAAAHMHTIILNIQRSCIKSTRSLRVTASLIFACIEGYPCSSQFTVFLFFFSIPALMSTSSTTEACWLPSLPHTLH